ncbi:MAG: DNA-binding domain-containing protein [Pseudomonadota bacterium]|nr:DNA-binding domain-containing protein [Pseudomonadota bacterium]
MTKKFISDNSNEAILYPVASASRLLDQAGHVKILADIEKNIATNETRYSLLYEPMINNFAEYVQVFCDIGKLGDEQLLNLGLERAYFICQSYVNEHGKDVNFTYMFALFSASLLLDIGRVDAYRKIMICNKNGVFLKEWQPILGSSLFSDADYYKVRESVSFSLKMSNLITPILAKNIVSEIGLLCLREEPDLLASWIAVLSHDENSDDDLASDFKIYNRKFNEQRKKRLNSILIDGTIVDGLVAGEEFWKWLKQGIKDKTIAVNKEGAFVHKVSGGLFVDYKALAQKFSSIYSDKFPSWTVVVTQFNSLGVAKLSGGDFKYEQFFGDRGKYGVGSMFHRKQAGSVAKLPAGVVIEDSRSFIAGDYKNSSKITATGKVAPDKDFVNRAGSVFGVNTKLDPKYEIPK